MSRDDGIKISIMCEPPKDVRFDVYGGQLAPTSGLLRRYKNGGISWTRYEEVFLEQIRTNGFLDKLI